MGNGRTEDTFEIAGHITVDAGLIWVGDPCYIIVDEDEPRPKELGSNWGDFCNKIFNHSEGCVTSFGHSNGNAGMGLAISTLYGDGVYPVYVQRNQNGRVRCVLIDFDNMFEDDGDEDEA